MNPITIRKGIVTDLPEVFQLIKELAVYENAGHEVINSIEKMEEDGFGKNPLFGFYVAIHDEKIIGMALYYYRYSTWKGKRLYLEDIVVTQTYRKHGVGNLLLQALMQQAIDDKCSGMMWQVLNWNEPAINFYKKYSTKFDNEWTNCHLEIETIKALKQVL